MSENGILKEEIFRQCGNYFARENRFWERLTIKHRVVSEEEIVAKQRLNEAIFRTGSAAAVSSGRKDLVETLNWEYQEVSLSIQNYRRIVT